MMFKAVAGLLTTLAMGQALAANVIQNGGFEANGAFIQSPDPISHWVVNEEGIFGGVQVTSDTASAVSGYATVGAAGGQYYALMDLMAPSRASLSQTFTLGAQGADKALLAFDTFINYATIGTETTFTNASAGLAMDIDNVQVRVDLLKAGANAFTTDAADIVASASVSPLLTPGPNPYLHHEFNLTGLNLLAGQSYTLRIAGVNTLGSLQLGVDNVALDVSPVPEPNGIALVLAGLSLMLVRQARRR